MNLRFSRLWPLFFITAFLFVPKFTFAADWANIGFANNNVKTVTVDQKNNQKILVSLASIFEGSYNFITENGGTSWAPISMGGAMTQCNGFVINPKTPNEIWAGCAVGLFRSIDGGNNFIVISNFQRTQSVNASVSVDGTVYITTAGNSLYKSTDGLIWETLRPPTSNNPPIVFTNKYAANEVYLSLAGTGAVGLYKSTDWGATWMPLNVLVPINKGINQLIFLSSGKMCASISTQGIGCSTDGGFTWGTIASPNPAKPSEYQHFYRLEQNPDDENNLLVLAGTWGGLDTKIYNYKSESTLPEILAIPDYTGAITISQGVVYSWSQNLTWTKGIWRNDGIAVVPEYLKKHPVIIVPGILGSWSTAPFGTWDFEPIFNTYTDLYNNFVMAGFEPGKTLFKFPYQWRADNRITASLLKLKIDEAKAASGSKQVDIVAHSMGGIVTRIYAQSDTYQNDIHQVVFLGTPQIGSMDSYLKWEAADFSQDNFLLSIPLRAILREEAWQRGYTIDPIINYIRFDVPSIAQLLPVYSYLNGKVYPQGYPRNELLEMLEQNMGVLDARGIAITNIVGSGLNTLYSADFINDSAGIYWPDGKPSTFYYADGDGTVLYTSQTNVPGENIIKNGVSHADLPRKSISDVFNVLDINYSPVSTLQEINKYLFIVAYSPIDFYVLAPDGTRIGYNKDGASFNEIEGAFYTGNDTDTEFLTIPNPLPGEYKVMTYGTGTGSYEIEATYADDETNKAITSSYSGQTTLGKEDKLLVNFSADANTLETTIDDKISPVTKATVFGTTINGYYNANVTLSLLATDTESGVAKTEYSIDGVLWQEYVGHVVLDQEGETVFSYRSVDNIGNVEAVNSLTIKIDKTAPIAQVSINKTKYTHWDALKLVCNFSDNYSGIAEATVRLDGKKIDCSQPIDPFDQTLGLHKVEYIARDNAGNTTSGEITYWLVVNYGLTIQDIMWLYANKHFNNFGEAVSLIARFKVAKMFDILDMQKQENNILNQILSYLEKQLTKNKITQYGYDMISTDIKYALEGE